MIPVESQQNEIEKYEKLCYLSQFIDRLKRNPELNRYPPDIKLETIEPEEKRDIIKNVYSMLDRNYASIGIYDRNIKTQCCNYLNYWLDTLKEKYVTVNKEVNDKEWKFVEDLWDNLKSNVTSNFTCERYMDGKSLEEKKKRINLMVYCVNRDELKDWCGKTSGSRSQNYCTVLPAYVKKNYELLVEENQCLKHKERDEDYEFHYSDKCSLHDIPNTFPDYQVEGGILSEKPSSRNPLTYCESTQRVTTDFQKFGEENPLPLTSEPSPPHSVSWNSITYSGLTISGILFSLIFLYKYTSLGSFLRSLIIKKDEMRQYIDAKGKNSLLETSSDYIAYNSENDEYNFSYQSLQI
ncbi:Plasmodium vivax Vir protein, putative [Plasmodium ovale]|uniref:Plasmodium vivax Vir protein, putative n=1 Tax=Plasmodium ovale TaxID=36330 RepID=A0A1C3KHK5_PLAOA|nr:Plasmodium vivax Vir protein, putative [Plasmodium ovale]